MTPRSNEPNLTPRRWRPTRRACAAIAVVLVAATSVFATTAVAGQDTTDGSGEVRIVARKLESGRIEFGLQQRQGDDTWGDRQLPPVRFFPTTATVGRWLASSSLDLSVGEVRIVARKLESGRIEFGLQQRQGDDTWGDRQLPPVRFFPTTATVGRWLASSSLILTAPQATGLYTASTVGDTYTCRLSSDGTLTCVGEGQQAEAPAGQYTAISAGAGHACGLRTDGTIACWGGNWEGQAEAPAGQYTAIAGGNYHTCGLRTDGTITCWGDATYGATAVPAGQYTAISAGGGHACGLRTDGTITCWGDATYGATAVPAGQYTAIADGSNNACGLRTDGTLTCWGGTWTGLNEVPAGRYTAISADGGHACGLRTDGTITCWGEAAWYLGVTAVPDGRYTAISAGGGHACGLRTDNTLTCWGDVYPQDVGSG